MPAKGKETLWFHAFNHNIPDGVFITRICDLSRDSLAGDETLALQRHSEPIAEFFGIRKRTPDSCARRIEDDVPFDSIGGSVHKATFSLLFYTCNRLVACFIARARCN